MRTNMNSGDDCIDLLAVAAISSKAVNHPYLEALQKGGLPNMRYALVDLAYQYGFYSSDFVRYVTTVINNLSDKKHRQILLENVAEEGGEIHDLNLPDNVLSSIRGVQHSVLYSRFQESLGIDDEYRRSVPPIQASLDWKRQFQKLCQENEYVGVGAIGIGTELLVSDIYKKVLEAIKLHTSLTPEQYVFFDLHSECDKEHAEQILRIARELAVSSEACEQIAYGATMAIEMRATFWDKMLERARSASPGKMAEDCTASYGH